MPLSAETPAPVSTATLAADFNSLAAACIGFGETHELEAQRVDEGIPAGFDDVVGDADSRPAFFMVGPFDENANLGRRPLFRIENANFVVSQADVGDFRIARCEAFAQRHIESVHRSVALGG